MGSSPAADKFFPISVFNLGIANGAKVELKLRLIYCLFKPVLVITMYKTVIMGMKYKE